VLAAAFAGISSNIVTPTPVGVVEPEAQLDGIRPASIQVGMQFAPDISETLQKLAQLEFIPPLGHGDGARVCVIDRGTKRFAAELVGPEAVTSGAPTPASG
jgi:hypothetical protein